MLFWVCLGILVIGIVLYVAGKRINNALSEIGFYVSIVSGLIFVIMTSYLVYVHIAIDAYVEQRHETYTALTYKVESGACRDDFGLLNKEVIDEIQTWNEETIYMQKLQDNFWVDIFIPDVYDQFEIIDYTQYDRSQIE